MYYRVYFLIMVLFFNFCYVRGSGNGSREFAEISGNRQLFSPEIEDKITSLSMGRWLEYCDAIWPANKITSETVPLSKVPNNVLQEAEDWVKRILKNEWVPEDLRERFIPIRKVVHSIPPEEVDYLCVRYKVNSTKIQILEDGAYMGILISEESQVSLPIEQYIKYVAEKYLKLPRERIETIKFELRKPIKLLDGDLYYGVMRCEDKVKSARRLWWHSIWVWSNREVTYFSTVERAEDVPLGPPQALAGIHKRFLR